MKEVSMRMSALELCRCEGVPRQSVISLVEYEVAEPVSGISVDDWYFDVDSVHWLRKALRLRRDLELEWVAVAMVVELLRTREHLERENRRLQQRLTRLLND